MTIKTSLFCSIFICYMMLVSPAHGDDSWRKSDLFLTDDALKALEIKVAKLDKIQKDKADQFQAKIIAKVDGYLNLSRVPDCAESAYGIQSLTKTLVQRYMAITEHDIHTSYDEGRVLFNGDFDAEMLRNGTSLATKCTGLANKHVDDLKLFIADLYEMGWGVEQNLTLAKKMQFDALVAEEYRFQKRVLPKKRAGKSKITVKRFGVNSLDTKDYWRNLCANINTLRQGLTVFNKILMSRKSKLLYTRKRAYEFIQSFIEKALTCPQVDAQTKNELHTLWAMYAGDGFFGKQDIDKIVLFHNYAIRNGGRKENSGYALAHIYMFGKYKGQLNYNAAYKEFLYRLSPKSQFYTALIEMELLGLGRPKSLKRAKSYLGKAVEAGDFGAFITKIRLDMSIEGWLKAGEINGKPIGRKTIPNSDYSKVFDGHPSAQTLLAYAVKLDKPNIHPLDNKDYLRWETKAACQGWPFSQALLAYLYLNKDLKSPEGAFWASQFTKEWSNSDLKFKSNKLFSKVISMSEQDHMLYFNQYCGD